jgi:hypothetical protein
LSCPSAGHTFVCPERTRIEARVHCRDIGTYRYADTMCILEYLSRGQGKSPVVRARWSLVYAYESQLVAALSQSRCLVSIACPCR